MLFSSIMMLVLLFLKVPVFVAVLGGSLVYFIMNPDINSVIFAQQMILGTEKISLLAIPFFVCAGIFSGKRIRSHHIKKIVGGKVQDTVGGSEKLSGDAV